MRTSERIGAALVVLAASVAAPAANPAAPGRSPASPRRSPAAETPRRRRDGLRVYHIGNSHTHSVRNVLMPLAHAAGHTNHTYSWSSILGAPLRWIRDHDKDSGGWEAEPYSQGLAPARAWDALTLQAYASDQKEVDAAVYFAGLALKGNAKCRIYLYTIWPGAGQDWQNPPPGRSEAFTERCAQAIAKAFPSAPAPRVIPSSLVIRELGRLADHGRLPHVRNRFALLADGGHLSHFGNYAVNVAFCSMLYDEPPFRYPHRIPRFRRRARKDKTIDLSAVQFEIPPETADVIKRVVWDVLATYPPARMNVGLVIADRSLPPAVAARTYEVKLQALNAKGKARWSLAEGKLPAGLALSPAGVLSGTPRSAGRLRVKVRVAAGTETFEKPFELLVCADEPPAVAEARLPGIPLDRHFFQALKARGGVGHLTWRLADGKLPHGVTLTLPGLLVGTPGEAGTFRFTARVTDSHPDAPRSAERTFAWSIGPASRDALLVPKTLEPVTIDGKLDESFWDLTHKIQRKARGAPTKTAVFAAAWTEGSKRSRPQLYLAVKVRDGAAGKTLHDAVELFLDALHDREVVYRADDSHFRISRGGRKRSVRGKPDWFLKVAAAETEGGWVLEMAIPTNYFIGEGSWVGFEKASVYGLDIAVSEGKGEVSQLTWRGTARNVADTSGFGSIVLTDTVAGAR